EIADDMLGEKLPELQELIGKDVTIKIRPTNVQGTIWEGEGKNVCMLMALVILLANGIKSRTRENQSNKQGQQINT
ncbi:hypothetical protein, partial [Enterococcus cecorum]|uniref:hypothetical protein n=1 Tax=Enterococcus cecorum TaxID=44008 RepID=UPI001FAE1F20